MKRLISDIKNFEGNVLCISVYDNKVLNAINKNNKINAYELKREEKRKILKGRKRVKMSNGKSVKIKKFRKLFKKKSIEYIIIDINNVFDYFKYMAPNSIYTCNTKVYLYGDSEYLTAKDVTKKFKRYKVDVESIQIENNFLVIVDVTKAKFCRIKELFYIIIDSFIDLGDFISYFLTS